MIKTSVIRFLKSPIKAGVLLVFWVCVSYFLFTTKIYWNEVNRPIDLMMEILPYIFLVYLVIAYECFYDIKRFHMEELLLGNGQLLRAQGKEFVVLLGADLLGSVYLFAFHIMCYSQADVFCKALVLYTVRVIFIYIFLMILVAICIGWAISLVTSRLYGLALIALTFYVFDMSFLSLLSSMSDKHEFLWKLTTLFSFFFQSRRGICRDADYLLTAENVHIYRALFFACFMLAIILWKQAGRKAWSVVSGMLAVTFLALFFQPTGAVYFMMNIPNTRDSVSYVERYRQAEYSDISLTKKGQNKKAFQVENYDMNVTVTDQFQAEACVVPTDGTQKEYPFTLQYIFQVDQVTDERGEKLTFEQDEDYLLVHNSRGKLHSIRIVYHGTTKGFYATTQGMMLPANYAYYPMPGWHRIFLESGDPYPGLKGKIVGDDCFSREVFSEETDFKVTLRCKGKYPVASNLKTLAQTKEHGFVVWKLSGRSDGITLIGNSYLVERNIEGVRVICSRLDCENVPEGENVSKYKELFHKIDQETKYSMKGKTFIVSPDYNYINWCVANDHIVDTLLGERDIIETLNTGMLYPAEDDTEVKLGIDNWIESLE